MMRFLSAIAILALAQAHHLPASAGEAPSYAKHIRPVFAKYCLECHNAKSAKGGLDLTSYKSMLEGSDNGPVLVPNEPGESILVLSIEGKGRSLMPPKTARLRPKADELKQVRAWVSAGAKDDSGTIKVALPDIRPKVKSLPPVRALAWVRGGQGLLAARRHQLFLFDAGSDPVMYYEAAEPITAITLDPRPLAAIAMGRPGAGASILLHPLGDLREGLEAIPAHSDVILDLALSDDGKLLATCSYDTQVKLWDASGKLLHTLKEHSDAVYGVAFSHDGKLLASTGADRAVKVWDAVAGKLLYTLGESTDWNYAVAFSPDGQHLAAAGVDKSIRVWPAGPTKQKLEHSVFAHEEPIVKLVYSADGKTLYSLGQDRIVKAWDAERMVERKVYDRLPETALALAIRPDGKQIAVGRFDGVVQLIDAVSGRTQAQLTRLGAKPATPAGGAAVVASAGPPAKPKPPEAKKITPAEGQRGRPLRVTIEGDRLDQAAELTFALQGASGKIVSTTPQKLEADIQFPATAPAGVHTLQVKSAAGVSAPLSFTVDLFARLAEAEPNDSPGQGQEVAVPASIVGRLEKAGDIDFFRFTASRGQQLGVQALTGAVGSKVDAVLQLIDDQGRVLAESSAGFLGHTFAEAGSYGLGMRDREFRGGAGMHYRLHVGPIPVITALYPLGLPGGAAGEVRVDGVFLDASLVKVNVPQDAARGSQVNVPITSKLGQPLGKASVVVGAFAEVRAAQATGSPEPALEGAIPVPGTANGYLRRPGDRDLWRFVAKKGQRLIVEVEAARLGGQLDSTIEILDAKGAPVPRAVLRCQAKTYVAFRDHDNVTAGIRIEAWDELGPNDYLYVNGELMRIRALPGHPDADCNFFASAAGPRIGFLDTTPTHHSQGAPMYKVTLHPPGTAFPPNGFPVFTINHRNDDGGPGYGRDSRIFFDPPADGEYRVRIGDARGLSPPSNAATEKGERDYRYGYRLTVRSPQPSFAVRFSPTNPVVWKEGAIPITVSADRIDGYEGPIAVRFENVPPGFQAPATVIEAGQATTTVALYAAADAKTPEKALPLKLVSEAVIDGAKQVKEATGAAPKTTDAGEIVAFTDDAEIAIQPGGRVKFTVHIERRRGFTGRVPLEVKGLPHGVHVLDIGLNGILITERETRRTIALEAERWVAPSAHPIVVLGKREGKNTEHAAKSVLLKVIGK